MVAEAKDRIKALFERGSQVDVNKNIPVHRYFRSGLGMISMANTYYSEEQYEDAYLLYAKFITLFVEKIKLHPGYKSTSSSARAANKKCLKEAFAKAENTKTILTEIFEQQYKDYQANLQRVDEIRRKHEEQEKLEIEKNAQKEQDEKMRQQKLEMDYFVEQQRRKELEEERLKIAAQYASDTTSNANEDNSLIPVDFAPPPPMNGTVLPALMPQPQTQKVVPKPLPRRPVIDRSLKPTNENEAISSIVTSSSNKYGMRTVICPANLPTQFLERVHSNSVRNVETCGVLFGNLSHNVFVLSHVLIPHQHGCADSCTTTREEDMWEFQEEHNVICLGWIHTHPSQTAFLSSVDLHTHYPYQCLMSESVAIVCSVKYNTTGYFMLTPNEGMEKIGKCNKSGFHPHQSHPPLFENCDHVQISEAHPSSIIDWRSK